MRLRSNGAVRALFRAGAGPRKRFLTASRRCSVVLLAALMFVACDAGVEPYANAGQVVRAMADAGVACSGFESGDEETSLAEGKSLAQGRGTCSIDGEDVFIATFGSSADRDDWVAVGRLLGPVAMGPNWIATSRSRNVVSEIVDALDATQASREPDR